MMLLTRKVGQSIVIGENIVVTVVRRDKESVKLGIEAPKHIRVDRKEIHELRKKSA